MNKKRGNKSKTNRQSDISPEFRKRMEAMNQPFIDLDGAPDEFKMSDRILRLIDPYMETMDTILLVDCATIAWNECIDEDFGYKSSYSLNNVLVNYAKYRDLINELKSRKRLMFKANGKHIKEAKVYKNGGNINVNVASDFDIGYAFKEMLADTAEELYETFSEADDDEFQEAIDSYEDDGDISKPNPYLKQTILAVVDNQLRDNDPPAARETFERLQAEGYTAKQAKEKIASVLVEDIHKVLTTKTPHDAKSYEKRLKALK